MVYELYPKNIYSVESRIRTLQRPIRPILYVTIVIILISANCFAHVNTRQVVKGVVTEEGGHSLHATKNNFQLFSSFQAITGIIVVIQSGDMLIIVKVERRLCLSGKMYDLYFEPNKIHYQPKNYITLKLVQSTIQIFNEHTQPHQYRFCTVVYGFT